MEIVAAQTEDHLKLTEITGKSKSYWGYSAEQLMLWNTDLTITASYIAENTVVKAVINKNIVAYYSLLKPQDGKIKLDNLFVLPAYMGRGIGSKLLTNALQVVVKLNCNEMWLEADPNSEDFYARHNFMTIGQKESSIPNRYLPVMCITLK